MCVSSHHKREPRDQNSSERARKAGFEERGSPDSGDQKGAENMKTMHRTFYNEKIEEIDILKETEKSVFYQNGDRHPKMTNDFYCHFDTFQEAHQFLIDREQQLLLDVDRNYRGKKEYAAALDAAESLIRKNAETIDEQASQIVALKAALLERELENIDPSLPSLEDAIEIATSQLAQEYPEIFAEEME